MFITDLANNPGVSNKELLSSACHASISSSIAYQTRDGVLESAKFAALGMELPSKEQQGYQERIGQGLLSFFVLLFVSLCTPYCPLPENCLTFSLILCIVFTTLTTLIFAEYDKIQNEGQRRPHS